MPRVPDIVIEDARIFKRNFSGDPDRDPFARPGMRFSLLVPDEILDRVVEEGWGVRFMESRDGDEDRQGVMDVRIHYGENSGPNIFLIGDRSGRKKLLDKDTVKTADFVYIVSVDLVLRPYEWEINGKSGIKPYVKSMYIKYEEDPFNGKYDDDEPGEEDD